MIKSTITGGDTRLVKTISTKRLIDLYKPYCDVSRFFTNLGEVDVYECLETGYRFYYPFSVAGDSPFYEELSKEELYYIPWKSEHDIADSYIKSGDTVLELGCANGDFLVKERDQKKIIPIGTELNEKAKATATARGISFSPTTTADVTCAFQVLEHIWDIKTFVAEAINSTKSGGYIIFGIPNNDCFIKEDPTCFLNMPPHHMGLWNESSLRKLADHFQMEVVDIKTEVLQPHHYRYYYQVVFGDKFKPLGFVGKVFNKLVYEIFAKFIIKRKAKNILGHTIVAVYKKL